MNWRITLSEPEIGREEIEAVTAVLESGWLTMGSVTTEFERQFAEKLRVRHAFAVCNCTAALHLAHVALGLSAGDEVICPALTFVASANAARYTGAEVVFADVTSEDDLTIDPDDIRAKITERSKAVVVVHYGGFPCRMDDVMAIAREYDLRVIEDCAHAPFLRFRDADANSRCVGTIGDIGCFSFYGNKNMVTGEGGMVVTNSDELAEKIRLLRSHGMTTLSYERHKGHASSYDVVSLGYNYRSDDMRSAIGLVQLQKIDRLNEQRRQVFQWYRECLKADPNVVVPFADRDLEQAVCHIMPVIIKDSYVAIKKRLTEARIQSSKHYDLIPGFTAYGRRRFESRVENIDNILTLPMYPALSKDDVSLICGVVRGDQS